MDFKIVWTLHSREDLRDIAAFIAKELRRRNLSLRVVVKEIPSAFGSFF